MFRRYVLFKRSVVFFIFFLLFTGLFQYAYSQSIDSVKEKIKNGDLKAAEEEVLQILKNDKNNVDALELLNQIKKLKKQKESDLLTEKAIIAIDNGDFEVAYDLLEKALVLNPENKKAMELFLSLNEVVKIEKQSEKEEQQKVEKETKGKEVTIAKGEGGAVAIAQGKKQAPQEAPLKETTQKKGRKRLELELFPLFAFTNSNKLSYVDSSQSLVGSGIGVSYYPGIANDKLGFSLVYLSYFVKASGIEYIKFNIHRATLFFEYRIYTLMDKKKNRMIIEPKIGYSFFYLNNLMEYSAYEIKKLYGPVVGVGLQDPIFSRFIDKDFFKKMSGRLDLNILYIPQKGAPLSSEIFTGFNYLLKKNLGINLGFRLYMVFKDNVRETYSDVELGASYFM